MPEPAFLRIGSRGEGVRDLQRRLGALGFRHQPDDPGLFGHGTEQAVRAFQASRGLQVDGLVGRDTWATLVESGFALGDRLLYYRHPMLRGDDVARLQGRLNALGFDSGRVDGIFGTETHRALTEFQRSTGLVTDGVCGPSTITALERVGSLADGSVATARERDTLRHGPHRLDGRHVFIASTPGLALVGDAVARGLTVAHAMTVLDASGDEASVVARAANRFEADLFVALCSGMSHDPECAYFETPGFRSETGLLVARAVHDELTNVLEQPVVLAGRAYPLLRETRMAAVTCELVSEGDADRLAGVVRRSGDVARAVVHGVRRAYEEASLDPA